MTPAQMKPLPRKLYIDGERRRKIAELAAAVAEEHCPSGAVDLLSIARAKRITHSFGRYGDAFDGMLELARGRFHIYCNRRRVGEPGSGRARFTFAHELGHYFLDEHRSALLAGRAPCHPSQSEYESPIFAEQEADLFAANLLLPAERFAKRARSVEPGLAGVLSLARAFETSVTTTAIRCAAVEAWPCAVLKWDRSGYAWKRLSNSIFAGRLRRTLERPDQLPPGCPTRRLLAGECGGEDAAAKGFVEAGTVASAWFAGVAPGALRDAVLIEQAISLGRWGALTMLRTVETGRRR